MTNGDKIRGMTDEELVKEVFAEQIMSCTCPPDRLECQESCDACWLGWLRSDSDQKSDNLLTMRTHELKIRPEYYDAILRREKTFELRKDDRGYAVGDKLRLRKYVPSLGYTGATISADVSYVLRDAEQYGLRPGHVILGVTNVHEKLKEVRQC